jgi:transposase
MPANLKRVVVYLQPISMRWGTTKLRALCQGELGIEPDSATGFLFVNKSHDSLLLYSTDRDGDRTLVKKIEKGAFMMPAPGRDGAPFIIMRPSILSRMFRS